MSIISDQEKVRKIILNSGSSFYWGMNILDKPKKRAMFSIYSFCRVVDDIADSNLQKEKKLKKLDHWKNKINSIYKKKKDNNFLCRELSLSVKNYNLQKKDFISIINGMKMDCKKEIIFPTKKELELYCDRVAGAVGCLSMHVFGIDSPLGREYAHALGRALQLTNILRDLKEDSLRNRCYLPKEYLLKLKLKKNEIKSLINGPEIQKICKKLLKEAKKYYDESEILLKKLDKKKLKAPELMKMMYKAMYKKMLLPEWKIEKKVSLNKLEKIFIILRIILRS